MSDPAPPTKARSKGPRKATAKYLRNAALYYLDRYATSAANLRRILLGKVERSVRAHGTEREEGAAAVEVLIADFLETGLLDDARYAEGRARALHRRGDSARMIRSQLAAKGVARGDIDRALENLKDETAEPELAAALAFARRRRIGPYRHAEQRVDMRDKDLAALGRRGFGYEIARRVVEAEDTEALAQEAKTGD